MQAFSETDPRTWMVDAIPEGYEWREFSKELGEDHLYAPDGRDLSAAYQVRAEKAHERGMTLTEYDEYEAQPRFTFRDKQDAILACHALVSMAQLRLCRMKKYTAGAVTNSASSLDLAAEIGSWLCETKQEELTEDELSLLLTLSEVAEHIVEDHLS